MAPGWTDYRERVVYQTYDVTSMLVPGRNAIGALLAPGWYSTPLEWFQQPNNYGDTPPAFRAQLMIEHADGSIEWVKTGPEWQAAPSHIVSTELYDGETQDARLMQQGWSGAAFVPNNWKAALVIEPKPVRHSRAGLSADPRGDARSGENSLGAETWCLCLRLRPEPRRG